MLNTNCFDITFVHSWFEPMRRYLCEKTNPPVTKGPTCCQPLSQIICLMALMRYVCCVIWFMWTFTSSSNRGFCMVANGLVPSWCQDIWCRSLGASRGQPQHNALHHDACTCSGPCEDADNHHSGFTVIIPGLTLGLRPANERRHYEVTPSLIGCSQT